MMIKKISILVLEDDLTIANGVALFLKQHNFDVEVAQTIHEATALIAKHTFHIALLDMMLPDGNGATFSKQLPAETKVLFISALDDEQTIVNSLNLGADDYVTKPFRLPILHARIQAIVRRYRLHESLTIDHLTIDPINKQLFSNGQPITLTANEQKLFFYLLDNRSHVVTREQILAFLWDVHGDFVNDNTLTVTIKRLRQKIEHDNTIIHTIRGVGYQIRG